MDLNNHTNIRIVLSLFVMLSVLAGRGVPKRFVPRLKRHRAVSPTTFERLFGWCGRHLASLKGRLSNSLVVNAEMSFAIELLGLAVNGGASLFHAIRLVGACGGGRVFSDLQQASRDFDAGMSKDRTLERLKERLPVAVIASFVAAIGRADRTGAPLAEVLSAQAEYVRKQTHLQKTKAMELIPLWIVLCTVTFLLPAVIIVAVVPHLFAFLGVRW